MALLGQAARDLILRRAIAAISAGGGEYDPRALLDRFSQPGDSPQVRAEIAQLIRSAASIMGTGLQIQTDPPRQVGSTRLPVDPSIRAGEPQYRARVLVSIPQPDGSIVTTLVAVPFDSPMAPAAIIAAAIAAASGNAMVPPPPRAARAGGPPPAPTGSIITIGRGSPTQGF